MRRNSGEINLPDLARAWSILLSAIRDVFASHGFSEVATPTLVTAPIPEPHIDAVAAGNGYLRTSPEAEMKILLTRGMERIFQIGPCFRAGEKGPLHSEEFTMLEWYRAGAGRLDLIPFVKELISVAANELNGTPKAKFRGAEIDFDAEWRVMTVEEAFAEFAPIPLEEALGKDIFDQVMVESVEPRLPRSVPVVLDTFPASQSTLAATAENPGFSLRWELYLAGVEIANTYTELTSPEEHFKRLDAANAARRAMGKPPYPPHRGFLDAVERGIPESAGSAMGLDRLLMTLLDATDIHAVRI